MSHVVPGLTFVELMITVALVTLIFTLINVNVSFLDKQMVRSEVRKLRAVCHYLQRRAMVTNQRQVLLFDDLNNWYTFNGQKEFLGNGMRFGTMPLAKGPPSDPLYQISSPITFAQKRIVFTPTGIIQPGTVYMVDRAAHYMYALTCSVAHSSYLRTYYYQGIWVQV